MSNLPPVVYIGKAFREVRTDPNSLLKKGGGGGAYKLNANTVLKVFNEQNPTISKKLQDMIAFFAQKEAEGNRIMQQITRPLEIAYDRNHAIIGFTMNYLTKDLRPMWEFVQPEYRKNFQVTPAAVAKTFLAGIPVIEHIHSFGMRIGDHNYRNTFHRIGNQQMLPVPILESVINQQDTNNPEWRVIDVDSFAFDRYGSEGDENFLDPKLYPVNLNLPVMTPGSDWYSFAVMLHWCITMCHPFAGGHRQVRSLSERSKQKISVFNQTVIYPSDALPLSVLSPELSKTLKSYFEGDNREPFPAEVLVDYIDQQEGRIAKQHYIPSISQQTSQQVVVQTVQSGVSVSDYELLLTVKGLLQYTLIDQNMVHALSVESNELVYYLINAENKAEIKRIPLIQFRAGSKVSVFIGGNAQNQKAPYVVVNPAFTEDLRIYEVTSSGAGFVGSVVTGTYLATNESMFSTGKSGLFYMISHDIFMATVEHGKLVSRDIRSYRAGQTWFIADKTSDEPRLVVSYNSIGDTKYVFVHNNSEYPLSAKSLELGESLDDVTAYFTPSHLLLVRKFARRGGKTFVRFEAFSMSGQSVFDSTPIAEADPNLLFTTVTGRVYSRTKDGLVDLILHATNDGIKQHRVQERAIKPFPMGQNIVDGSTALNQIKANGKLSILAVNANSIYRIG